MQEPEMTEIIETATVTDAGKLHQVLTWMLEGNSEHLIREAIKDTWPGEDAAPLILAAIEHVSQRADAARETLQDWCLEATRFLYQKQVEIGDYTGALRTVKELNAMAKKKPSTKQAKFPRISPNDQDRKQELAARIARLG